MLNSAWTNDSCALSIPVPKITLLESRTAQTRINVGFKGAAHPADGQGGDDDSGIRGYAGGVSRSMPHLDRLTVADRAGDAGEPPVVDRVLTVVGGGDADRRLTGEAGYGNGIGSYHCTYRHITLIDKGEGIRTVYRGIIRKPFKIPTAG